MNFNFNETAGITNGTKSLEPNKIHVVKFDGVEAVDGVEFKNGKKGDVLDIKFSNDEGAYSHRIFEPSGDDFEDRTSQYGKNPSNVKAMMLLFKHLIDAVNPELGKKIDAKESKINAESWKGLRKLMIEATKPGIGKETKIKLVANKDGYASFPFFASYNKKEELYMSSYFIGNSIYFSPKELTKINTIKSASPTPMGDAFSLGNDVNSELTSNSDLDFNL